MGQAELEATASALGSAWLVGIKGGGSFYHVMSTLNATVGSGRMTMEELVHALGSGIIPVAHLAGLSIQDIGAALATLSDSGFSASSAAAQLGTALHFLYAPTTKAKKALESIGLTQSELIKQMSGPNGLHGALALLKGHLSTAGDHAEQLEKMGEIFPGGRGKVLLTLMDLLDRLEMKKKQIIATGGNFKDSVQKTMEQPAVKIQKAWSAFQAELIRVGQTMEGPAAAALMIFVGLLKGVLGGLMAVTGNGKLLIPIILGLGGAFLIYKGAVIAAAIAQWAYNGAMAAMDIAAMVGGIDDLAAAWVLLSAAMDANPVGLLVMGIALLIAGVAAATYYIVTHFRQTLAFLKQWGFIAAALILGPFVGLGVFVATHFDLVKSVIGSVLTWIEKAWGKLGHILAYPFEWLWGKVLWVVKQIKGALGSIVNAPGHAWKSITGGINSLNIPGMPSFAAGGVMGSSGLALINETATGETVWLPGGSSVQPSPATSLAQPRAHTPNPAPASQPSIVMVEAWLTLPGAGGRRLFKLLTQEAAIKEARRTAREL